MLQRFFTKNAKASNDAKITKQSYIAMGTLLSFTARHNSQNAMLEAFNHAMQEVERLEAIFSRHNANSALFELNKNGQLKNAPKELLYVLEESLIIAKASNEIYNPAIKPILDLFEQNKNVAESAQTIDKLAMEDAKNRIDINKIKIDNSSITFRQKEMGITLDSIAKGYILDRISAVLEAHNVSNHVINAGGDIIAKGHRASNEAWIVGVEDPNNLSKVIAEFPLVNGAVATSGSYHKFFDKDKSRHHIIDPKSGTSPLIYSVTCKAESAMYADAYSTLCSISGKNPYTKYRII